MPIQPIDLQTLFVKMNQVGREQAALKNSAVVQQEIQGSEIVKKNQHDDKSVHRAETPESGSEKVKEDGSQGSGQQKNMKKIRKMKIIFQLKRKSSVILILEIKLISADK